MGVVSNSRGINTSVQISTSTVSGSDSFFFTKGQYKSSGTFRGGLYTSTQRSCRNSASFSSGSRVLFPPVSSSKENRWNETCHRPVHSEHFSNCSTFQDGNKQVNKVFDSSIYVDNFTGSFGRLFSCPNFSSVQEVPSFCLEQPGFPIQSSAFWPSYSPLGFYQGYADSYGPSSFFGHSDPLLSGRLSFERIQSTNSLVTHPNCNQLTSAVGVSSILEKIRDKPISGFCFSGGTLQDRSRSGVSSNREILPSLSENQPVSFTAVCDSSSLFTTARSYELFSRCHSFGTSTYSSSSILSPSVLDSGQSGLGSFNSNSPVSDSSLSVVVSQGECSHRSFFNTNISRTDSLHRRLSSGLGSFSRRTNCVRFLDSSTTDGTHQRAGDESCAISSTTFQKDNSREITSVGHRQHNCGSLSPESGRYSLSLPISSCKGNSAPMFSTSDTPFSSAHSGETQHPGRFTVQDSLSGEHRMGTSPISVSCHNSSVGLSSFRSFCYKSKSQASHLCISSSGPQGSSSRCNEPLMEGNVCLCLPSFSFSGSGASEDCGRELQDHTYCSGLAKTSLVSRSSSALLRSTSSLTSETRPSLAIQRKSSSSTSRESSSSRLVAVRNNLTQRGFSEKAAKHISRSVRESTNIVYDAKWTIFSNWCSGRKVNPFQVTVQQLADFLVFLFEVKGLSPSTIKGYRSAISRTLVVSGGPDFGSNEFISLLVRNFSLEKPRQKILVPQWDLGLVLSAFNVSPFEPADSVHIKFLSYKCCFLLALASGRRRSELHALSISDSCLRFNRDLSSVTLLTDPSFLAKNQIPDRGADPIVIPALPSDSDSNLLCPVRILRIYLDRTRSLRTAGDCRLFIPIKKGVSSLSVKTISTWICKAIFLAYESSGVETLNKFKAHDVRAISSSWALFNSASLNEVLSAGFWRNENSFISHYLRSMSKHADSLFSLGPIVSAQRINFPPVSSNSGDSALR